MSASHTFRPLEERPSNKHKCPVLGCTELIPHALAMCKAHWYLVPRAIKFAVKREYQERPRSEAHFAAVRLAVEAATKSTRPRQMGPRE